MNEFFNRKGWLKKILSILFILTAFAVSGQDVDSRSPKPAPGSSQQRKADKKKEIQRKKIEKGNERGRKRQIKIQSKNTKKMMRKSRRLSKKFNDK